jgi:hypothetical protein
VQQLDVGIAAEMAKTRRRARTRAMRSAEHPGRAFASPSSITEQSGSSQASVVAERRYAELNERRRARARQTSAAAVRKLEAVLR